MKLEEKVSIVTGGGQGIGRAVSLKLAEEGSDVLVSDVVKETAKQVAGEVQGKGRKADWCEVDVSNGNQVKEMVEMAMDTFGRIDVLVNVAGIVNRSPIEETTEEDWERVMAVNLKGTFLCSRDAGKVMIKQGGGSIVNFASVAGHTPQIYLGAYSSSKAGVILLTKMMAIEWAKHKVRVNAVSPGPITTPMTQAIYHTPELKARRARAVPMNRFGEPEEVANTVAFLASDDSSYITGQSLPVDGGFLDGTFYLGGLLSG